jgi:hypothetical protein
MGDLGGELVFVTARRTNLSSGEVFRFTHENPLLECEDEAGALQLLLLLAAGGLLCGLAWFAVRRFS